jgi:hypothetical protein
MNLEELKGYKQNETLIGNLTENSEENIQQNLADIRSITKDDVAFVFFNKKDGQTHALLVSQRMIEDMLKSASHYAWDNVYYIRNSEKTVVRKIADAYEPFPLFYNNYQFQLKLAVFSKLLQAINLSFSNKDNIENTAARDYTNLFAEAVHLTGSEVKLTGYADQVALAEIFTPLLDTAHGIADDHFQQISEIYTLSDQSETAKAKTLFCLAAMFVTYSSSFFFGQEGDSPIALRNYAAGLITKAYELDPSIFKNKNGVDKYGDWINRLTGQNAAFTCTAVLKTIMKSHAKEVGFDDEMGKIKPPGW